jgi:prepilin-type N-terminal cleavage/methylation domain-containing protein
MTPSGIERNFKLNKAVDQNGATPPHASSASQAQRGFTLIETLIATVVLAFGLLSVASLLAYSLATNYENRMDSVATNLAIQRMEQLRGQAFSTISNGGCALDGNGNIDFAQAAVTGYSQTTTFNNRTFDIRWNIATSDGLTKIVVAARRSGGSKRYLTNVLRPVNVRCLKQD